MDGWFYIIHYQSSVVQFIPAFECLHKLFRFTEVQCPCVSSGAQGYAFTSFERFHLLGMPPPSFPQFPPIGGAGPFPPIDMSVPPPQFGQPPPHIRIQGPHQGSNSPHQGPPHDPPQQGPHQIQSLMPPVLDPNDPSLIPLAPYYELPAGLMVTLIKVRQQNSSHVLCSVIPLCMKIPLSIYFYVVIEYK